MSNESKNGEFSIRIAEDNVSGTEIDLSVRDLKQVHSHFLAELYQAEAAYKERTPNNTSIPFVVVDLPQSKFISEEEKFGVIILGGTKGEIAVCRKSSNGFQIEDQEKDISLPTFTTTDQLASFFAGCLQELPEKIVINAAYHMKPIIRDGKLDGELQRLGKTLKIDSLLHKPFGEEIEKALTKQTGKQSKVAVANDGVCLLLSGRNEYQEDELAFGIIGTGLNFGFFLTNNQPVILESHAFKFPDNSSPTMKKFGDSFSRQTSGRHLYQRFNQTVQELGLSHQGLHSTEELNSLGDNNTPILSEIARRVLRRSAQLSACQIAGIANFKERDMTFVMEGSLYGKGHGYKSTLEETVKQLCSYNVRFTEVANSGVVGAMNLN